MAALRQKLLVLTLGFAAVACAESAYNPGDPGSQDGALLQWLRCVSGECRRGPLSPLKRRQFGETAFNGTTQSVTIEAVDRSRSFVLCHADLDLSNPDRFAACNLSSATTIDLSAGAAPGIPGRVVAWSVVEFSEGARVQSGSAAFSGPTLTVDVPIASVDLGKAFALAMVTFAGGAVTDRDEEITVTAALTSGTNLELKRNDNFNASPITVYWQVIELAGARVQQRSGNMAGALTTNVPIDTVATGRTFLVTHARGSAASNGVESEMMVAASLLDSQTVLLERSAATNAVDVVFYVVELEAGSLVQSGSITLGGGLIIGSTPLNPAVDTLTTFPVFSTFTGSGWSEGRPYATLSNQQITFRRKNGAGNGTFRWFAVRPAL